MLGPARSLSCKKLEDPVILGNGEELALLRFRSMGVNGLKIYVLFTYSVGSYCGAEPLAGILSR